MICGPTAAGKTALAMSLFDRLGGADHARLISVDSTLVYRGMDIGTAKPSVDELNNYPHDLIDILNPQQIYNAADFVADADQCIQQAWALGQVPILVGGTMLYFKCFLQGIANLPSADADLRATLMQRLEDEGSEKLHAELAAQDPAVAAKIHPNNPQRLLRALEVIALTGNAMSTQWQQQQTAYERLAANVLQFGLMPMDRQILHKRIESRFDDMLAAGFVSEVEGLISQGQMDIQLPSMRAVGYRQACQYLRGEIDYEQFRADALTATRRLAKRQLTWMRSWPGLNAMSADRVGDGIDEIDGLVQQIMRRMGEN